MVQQGTLTLRTSNKRVKGFTLIEVMIVMVLISTGMTTLYQLLKAVWAERLSGNTSVQIEQFFKFGRQHALQKGITITMEIDLEKRKTGLRPYEPKLEGAQDKNIYSLAQQNASKSYRGSEILNKVEERIEELDGEEEEQPKEEWILNPTSLPSELKKIYGINGIELIGPKIFVHFYPNATSDSLIFKFNRKKKPYLYLPRYNIPAIFLDDLDIQNVEINENNLENFDN